MRIIILFRVMNRHRFKILPALLLISSFSVNAERTPERSYKHCEQIQDLLIRYERCRVSQIRGKISENEANRMYSFGNCKRFRNKLAKVRRDKQRKQTKRC